MRRYDADGGIPTLDMALSEFMNTEDLRRLGALTGEKLPTRKLDLAQVIIRAIESSGSHHQQEDHARPNSPAIAIPKFLRFSGRKPG